jgi:hypothetical protein
MSNVSAVLNSFSSTTAIVDFCGRFCTESSGKCRVQLPRIAVLERRWCCPLWFASHGGKLLEADFSIALGAIAALLGDCPFGVPTRNAPEHDATPGKIRRFALNLYLRRCTGYPGHRRT